MSEFDNFADWQFDFSTAALVASPSAPTPLADAKGAFDAVIVAGANATMDSTSNTAPPALTNNMTDFDIPSAGAFDAATEATYRFGNEVDWATTTPTVLPRSDVARALQFLFDTNLIPIKELLIAIANYTSPALVTVSTLVGAPAMRSAAALAGSDNESEIMGPGATQCALLGGGKELAFVDSSGNAIQKLNLQTLCVTTIAGFDLDRSDGAALSARFYLPYAIAYNRHDSSLLVADYNGSCLRQISGFDDTGTSSGGGTVRTIAGHPAKYGCADAANGAAVRFERILSILISDKQDVDATTGSVATSVYLCEETGARLRHVSLPTGRTTTLLDGSKLTESKPTIASIGADLFTAYRGLSTPFALAWDHSVRTPDEINRDGGRVDGEVMYIATRELLTHPVYGRVPVLRRYHTATRELWNLPLIGGWVASAQCLVWFCDHTLLVGTESGVLAVSTRTGRTSFVAGHTSIGYSDGDARTEARFNFVSSLCVRVDDATGTEQVLAVDRNNRMIRLVQGSIRADHSSQPDFEYR